MATATLTFIALNQRQVIRFPTHVEDFIVQSTGFQSSGAAAAAGAIVAEGSADGINWVALEMQPVGGGASFTPLTFAAAAIKVPRIMEYMSVRMSVAGDMVVKISFKEVP